MYTVTTPVSRRRPKNNAISPRSFQTKFTISKIDGSLINVCKETFLKALQIKKGRVQYVTQNCVLTKRHLCVDRNNQQYLPGIVEDILRLCKLLPIWSAIMVPYFGYGSCATSSCAVETHFGILKNTIFRNELPARLDHFVTKHARYNQGNILVNFETETDHVGHIESIHAEKEIKSETQELR